MTKAGRAHERNIEDVLHEHFDRFRIPPLEKSLTQELAFGVVRRKLTLDTIVSHFSNKDIEKIQPVLLNILRVGLYQLIYLDKVPDYAAINEAVKLAKKYVNPGAGGFVNALLRKIIAAGKTIEYPSREEDSHEYLSIKFSHPKWLAERWTGFFGGEKTEEIFSINNVPPPVYIRVNQTKISAHDLLRELENELVKSEIINKDIGALILHSPGNISELETFRLGYFYVQDLTAMQAALFLAPKKGERILDACAAPGGKSTHLAELTGNDATIVGVDQNLSKISLIVQNAARLQTPCVQPVVGDAAKLGGLFKQECFDRIILDAPCSNTGVFRRRVEARWRLKPEDFSYYQQMQLNFLTECAPLLKKGGTLVYCTCSIDPEENQQVVEKFLELKTGWELVDQKSFFPSEDQGDGGYMARLRLYL